MTLKAMVIGGTGFLGLNIMEALLQDGASVTCTRRRGSNTIFARRMGVPLVEADLTDEAALADAMRGREMVFMAATPYPRFSSGAREQIEHAVRMAVTCVRAARRARVNRVVFTSSVATVAQPEQDTPATEDAGPPRPELLAASPYFAMKHAAETAALAEARQGPDLVVLNPTGCVGPYDYRVGTGILIVGIATGRMSHYVDGWVDLADVRDVARAHVSAAFRGQAGGRYILSGETVRVGVLLRDIARRLDTPFHCQELSPAEAIAFADREEERSRRDPRSGRALLSRALVDILLEGGRVDSARARAGLGFHPRPLGEALDNAINWYRRNGFLRPAAPATATMAS
ncbi:MAG: hypothetical protein GMKNLPBB_01639 [Myxococcota bacterium]|nr:hypothetical protein [Myxococcota bacterium]